MERSSGYSCSLASGSSFPKRLRPSRPCPPPRQRKNLPLHCPNWSKADVEPDRAKEGRKKELQGDAQSAEDGLCDGGQAGAERAGPAGQVAEPGFVQGADAP